METQNNFYIDKLNSVDYKIKIYHNKNKNNNNDYDNICRIIYDINKCGCELESKICNTSNNYSEEYHINLFNSESRKFKMIIIINNYKNEIIGSVLVTSIDFINYNILNCIILPKYQKQGYGTKLLNEIKNQICYLFKLYNKDYKIEQKCPHIVYSTLHDNYIAHNFVKKNGYQIYTKDDKLTNYILNAKEFVDINISELEQNNYYKKKLYYENITNINYWLSKDTMMFTSFQCSIYIQVLDKILKLPLYISDIIKIEFNKFITQSDEAVILYFNTNLNIDELKNKKNELENFKCKIVEVIYDDTINEEKIVKTYNINFGNDDTLTPEQQIDIGWRCAKLEFENINILISLKPNNN